MITPAKHLEIRPTGQGRLDSETDLPMSQWMLGNLFDSDIFFSMKNSGAHDGPQLS
jgi:hypothetical protein